MEEAAEIAASFCVEEDETKVRRPTDRVCKREVVNLRIILDLN